MAATPAALCRPRATSGWFVTTTRTMPMARRRRHASATPGSTTSSSGDRGAKGLPSRTTASLSTPSRSRNTAPTRARAGFAHVRRPDLASSSIERSRCVERLARRHGVGPSQGADAVGVDPHHGHVALPAPVAARVPQGGGGQPEHLDGELGDLGHGDVVAGGHVEGPERARGPAPGQQDGVDDVGHVHVGLALPAVAQDVELGGILEQAPDEVVADAVGLAGPDHVPEPEHTGVEVEHEAVRGDERLSGELAGAVGRHRDERSVVLGRPRRLRGRRRRRCPRRTARGPRPSAGPPPPRGA